MEQKKMEQKSIKALSSERARFDFFMTGGKREATALRFDLHYHDF